MNSTGGSPQYSTLDWKRKCQAARSQEIPADASFMESSLERDLAEVRDALLEFLEISWNSKSQSTDDTIIDSSKDSFLRTRHALRFALACFSLHDTETRQTVQCAAAMKVMLYEPLLNLLSINLDAASMNQQQKQQIKSCQVLAAKVMCNMVTANLTVAEWITARLAISSAQEQEDNNDNSEKEDSPTWTSLVMMTAARNRPALAPIVAALYNCVCSLSSSSSSSSSCHDFPCRLACDSLLMRTMIRLLVTLGGSQANSKNQTSTDKDTSDQDDPAQVDEATDAVAIEWMELLLTKLCCHFGFFPQVYLALGNGCTDGKLLQAEHLILLDLMRHYHTMPQDSSNMIPHQLHDTVIFLAKIYVQTITTRRSKVDKAQEKQHEEALFDSAREAILDILANLLGTLPDTTSLSEKHRADVGSIVLPNMIQDLAALTDRIRECEDHSDNFKMRGRNETKTNILCDADCRLIVSMVRCIGNLCFDCRANQDLLRTTSITSSTSDGATKTGVEPDNLLRNGLHVLLTCTSFSTSCFTLREWAVVAIRNALDKNDLNQQLVAELQAQQAVQSTALQEMGIRVDLDPTSGKVSVAPLPPEQQP